MSQQASKVKPWFLKLKKDKVFLFHSVTGKPLINKSSREEFGSVKEIKEGTGDGEVIVSEKSFLNYNLFNLRLFETAITIS